ncbi:MAG: hypothetical protein F6J89_08420 [Symploca sp. SIO1C4]|uniref:Uncharacterized protein n=1 Tax=Symploca sp. SIO1C4 TaxID=2607765 RepID=A0A6B3N1T9_9CYAN|nr:hypothetical protein [Symploca sp. SIO1C4]NET05467.1 hypothetical protein [Symploca sp. SIO2B6]NET47502.1 hypothetical protein [Merismopedia sp. SIO2A8]
MRIWITSFLVLFGIFELYQWMKNFSVPLPMFILAGALLAIASNYGKYGGWSFQDYSHDCEKQQVQQPNTEDFNNASKWANLQQSLSKSLSKPQDSISFTINRREQK